MAPLSYRGRAASKSAATISLFLDIGQGAGLAGASGVRPPYHRCSRARSRAATSGSISRGRPTTSRDGSAPLAAVLALAVPAYALDRRRPSGTGPARDPATVLLGGCALALGALLFAGSLAEGHHESWPGSLRSGSRALGYAAVAGCCSQRARRRLTGGAAGLLSVYADAIALALAGLAIALPPVGIVAAVVFAALVVRARSGGDGKYEGLRVLR